MEQINITSAQYIQNIDGNNSSIQATINGITVAIPLDPANSDYAEIMRQVEAGTLTIQAATDVAPDAD